MCALESDRSGPGDPDAAIGERGADRACTRGPGAVAVDVPGDDRPVRCPECGMPFREERLRTLHRGRAHYDELDDADRERFAAAADAEEDRLGLFRLKLILLLVAVYFSFLFTYAVVT